MHEIARTVGCRLDATPSDAEALQGGMVGEVFRIDFEGRPSVVAKRSETPLALEATMLRYLAEHGLAVPGVLAADDDLLVLEFVAGSTSPTPAGERAIADALAALHDHTAEAFGFERDTLLGPLELPNEWTDDWIPFYREHRLLHFASVARERDAIEGSSGRRVRSLADDLDAILAEPDDPALLHGDVWRENVLTRDGEVAAFLDPACYYGHPEEELAYVDWTSAFGDAFFERYRERREIESGFERRKRCYSVPRLLVHAALFGGQYPRRLRATLDELGY